MWSWVYSSEKRRRILRIYSNDGPGLRRKEFDSKRYQNVRDKYVHFVPEKSYIGMMLLQDKYSTIKSSSNGALCHQLSTWEVLDDRLRRGQLSDSSKKLRANIHHWLQRHDDGERRKLERAIFGTLEKAGIMTTHELLNIPNIVKILKGIKDIDEESRNLVIDISTNLGGSADVVMAMVSLITGRSEISYENALTGQRVIVSYAIDRNFDGVFDDKDAEVRFDLNFAVLTSRISFSCANLFSSIMHDSGILLLGERSGGGACAVSVMNTADGYDFLSSSWRMRLTNEAGEIIDSGIPVDVDLSNHGKRIEVLVYGYDQYGNPRKEPYVMDDYRSFYDIETLSRAVNEAYTVPIEFVPAVN